MASNLLTTPSFPSRVGPLHSHDIKVPSNEDIPWSLLLEHRPAILLAPRVGVWFLKIQFLYQGIPEKGGSITDPSDTSRDLNI